MTLRKKTLLIFIPGFPADESDKNWVPFPQNFVRNLAGLYPTLQLIVLTFQYPASRTAYQWHGVTVKPFNGRNRGKIRRLLQWKKIWSALGTIMAENDVAGILSFWLGECSLLANWAARQYHVPAFMWLMGQDARIDNRYTRLIRPSPGSLIALSDFLADEFFRNFHLRPAHVIPPGVDQSQYARPSGQRPIDILAAGSLIPLKRFEQLIVMVAALVATMPHIRAVLCGQGPERARLESLIISHHLQNNIELVGELPNAQLLALMQTCRVFVHPSEYEGFSTVCTEALYSGAQVVAYCRPMHEEIRHLHVVRDARELELKVSALLRQPDLDHQPVLIGTMEECCRNIVSLYHTLQDMR